MNEEEKKMSDMFEELSSENFAKDEFDYNVESIAKFNDHEYSPHDPEWNDYVMRMFTEDELVEGMPKVSGLRRIAEKIFGPPLFSGPTQVFPSSSVDHPGRATVVFKVDFVNASYSDVADSWEGNTDDAFVVYNVAMASTRAEARALRKAFRLHTAAFEEITKKDTASITRKAVSKKEAESPTSGEQLEGGASTRQLDFISKLIERAGVDYDKFVVDVLGGSVNGRLTKQMATVAINTLNAYINGSLVLPENIRK
jgi:hypothetical protein